MILLPPSQNQRDISLSPISDEEAAALGEAFAAIDPWARYPYTAGALQAYFQTIEEAAPRYAIRSGAALMGAIGLRLNWLRGPYIQFLGLLPAFQSQRTGQRVLSWLEDDLRSKRERNLWVAASNFNDRAVSFYERSGFRRVAELDDLVREGHTELLLRKKLWLAGDNSP